MKKEKDREIPATSHRVLDYLQCELCGKQTHNANDWSDTSTGPNNTIINKTKIVLTTGDTSYDSGLEEKTIIDMCHTCFVEKLVPWVIANGGTPRTEEIEW